MNRKHLYCLQLLSLSRWGPLHTRYVMSLIHRDMLTVFPAVVHLNNISAAEQHYNDLGIENISFQVWWAGIREDACWFVIDSIRQNILVPEAPISDNEIAIALGANV